MVEDLELTIEEFDPKSQCGSINSYPKEWVEDIVAKQKAIFKKYDTKADRVKAIDEVRADYYTKFKAKGLVKKIKYEDKLYTLKEAKTLLAKLKSKQVPINKEPTTQAINEACTSSILAGFTSKALGSNHKYKSDMTSQTNLISLLVTGVAGKLKVGVVAKGEVTWSYKSHSKVELVKVSTSLLKYKQTQLDKAYKLKELVRKATTRRDLANIRW